MFESLKYPFLLLQGYLISFAIGLRILRVSPVVSRFADAVTYHSNAFRLLLTREHPKAIFLQPNPDTDAGVYIASLYEIKGYKIAIFHDHLELWDSEGNSVKLSTADRYVLSEVSDQVSWDNEIDLYRQEDPTQPATKLE